MIAGCLKGFHYKILFEKHQIDMKAVLIYQLKKNGLYSSLTLFIYREHFYLAF